MLLCKLSLTNLLALGFFSIGLAQPVLIPLSPDPTTNQTPTLAWDSVPSATDYKIVLDDDISFATPIVSTIISNATSFTVANPLSSGHYYWHVSSNLNYALFSKVDDFTVNVPEVTKPILIPVSPDPTTNQKPTLSWNSVPSATNYNIVLDDDISFTTPIVSTTISNATSFTVANPLSSGHYYWHVSSNLNYALFSDVDDFTVNVSEVTKPIIIPVSPDPTTNQKPTLSWNSVPSATNYNIVLDDDISFTTPIVSTTISNATSFTVANPLSSGHYYWHVSSNLNYDLFSDVDDFTVNIATITKPVLIPISPDTIKNPYPIFSWNNVPSAYSYKVEIDDDISFATPITSYSTSGATSFKLTQPLSNGHYYWHVSSNLNFSLFSDIDDFVLKAPAAVKPTLNEAIIDSIIKEVTLSWKEIADVSNYHVELSTDSAFKQIIFSTEVNATTFMVPCPLQKGTYYWRVSSNLDYLLYSSIGSFILKKPTEGIFIGVNHKLSNEYKTRTFTIGSMPIALPEYAYTVNILITNLSGKKVYSSKITLSNANLKSIQPQLTSGSYIAIIDFFDEKGSHISRKSNGLLFSK